MSRLLRYSILLGSVFALMAVCSKANTCTTCYIDYQGGNDSNSGADTAHPWKHLPGMSGGASGGSDACTSNCAAQVPKPGDKYILKGGVVWPYTVFPLTWSSSWSGSGTTSAYGCTGAGCIYVGIDPSWNLGQVNTVTLKRDLGFCKSAPSVIISGGGGSGATATVGIISGATFSNGLLTYFTITSPGSGYTSNPTVALSGGGCTGTLAVADIQRAAFDYGSKSGYVWNFATPGFSAGPFYVNRAKYVVFDNLELRNFNTLATSISNANGQNVSAINGTNTVNVTYSNFFVHNWSQSTKTPGQQEGVDGIQSGVNGQFDSTDISYNFVNNAEQYYLSSGSSPCYQGNAQSSAVLAAGTLCTFGGNAIRGGADVNHNYVYGTRGGLGAPTTRNNELWNLTFSCCGGHGDALYIIPTSPLAPNCQNTCMTQYIFNNIIHDTPGAANIYLTMANGTIYYVFNNVEWNLGIATPPVGIDIVFGAGPNPSYFYIYNNTFVASQGVPTCINSGGGTPTYASSLNLQIYNNHCISDATLGHWYVIAGSGTKLNGSLSQAQVDAANIVMPPTTAVSQGYSIATLFAPPTASSVSATTAGKNLAPCNVALAALCSDILGNPRATASTVPWNIGAYTWSGKVNPPQSLVTTAH